MATTDLVIRIGDSWASPTWAVLIGKQGVDLADGWTVHAQARRQASDQNVEWTWSSEPGGGDVEIGSAAVTLADGTQVPTSTVRLRHTGQQTEGWDPWHGVFDVEIRKGEDVYTVAEGTVRAVQDVTR